MDNNDGALFEAYVRQNMLRPVDLYTRMGMTKQNFYQLFKSKKFEDDTIRKVEKATGQAWSQIRKMVNIDYSDQLNEPVTSYTRQSSYGMTAVLNLTESNKVLSQANKSLAEAHHQLTRDSHELMLLYKSAIEHGHEENQLAADAKWSRLLAILAEIGAGKLGWKSADEGVAILSKLLSGEPRNGKVAGTPRHSDKSRRSS